MDRTVGIAAQESMRVNDWLTLVRAYNNLMEYALGKSCICGCGHVFETGDDPIFTMHYVRIEGEDTQELRINWFNTTDCIERARHLT